VVGPGAEALGFARGQRVDREPYDLLFGERKGPEGAQLGRPPRFAQARERYWEIRDQLLAAEPHAMAEREAELRIEAAKRARLSPLYMDLTVSLSKSISVSMPRWGRTRGWRGEQEMLPGRRTGPGCSMRWTG
jgi:hypothetical protein